MDELAFCFIFAVADFIFSYGLEIGNFMIAWINCFVISYAVIVYPHGISVKYFVELVLRWKKCFPIFLTKFALYGRLNHIIFCPYVKDNNKIIYVNTESNRTISIIKQLPKSIELRLSPLSAFEEIFKNSIKPFKEA